LGDNFGKALNRGAKMSVSMSVSMSEFKANLAKYISNAQSGERVDLTSHKKVVAYVVGVPAIENQGIQQMIASGAASWQGGAKPKGVKLVLTAGGKSLSTIVHEDRG
jgi:antitoxin (DNA-binding transcriptional repressor) of toxin-antitoxin stability system